MEERRRAVVHPTVCSSLWHTPLCCTSSPQRLYYVRNVDSLGHDHGPWAVRGAGGVRWPTCVAATPTTCVLPRPPLKWQPRRRYREHCSESLIKWTKSAWDPFKWVLLPTSKYRFPKRLALSESRKLVSRSQTSTLPPRGSQHIPVACKKKKIGSSRLSSPCTSDPRVGRVWLVRLA